MEGQGQSWAMALSCFRSGQVLLGPGDSQGSGRDSGDSLALLSAPVTCAHAHSHARPTQPYSLTLMFPPRLPPTHAHLNVHLNNLQTYISKNIPSGLGFLSLL